MATPTNVIETLADTESSPLAAPKNLAYHHYVRDRARAIWRANAESLEFAPYIKDGHFDLASYMKAQDPATDDEPYQEWRNNVITNALQNWASWQQAPQFAPFIHNGQFYLGSYLINSGITIVDPDSGETLADLTEYFFDGASTGPLNNVLIDNADLTQCIICVDTTAPVTNFGMSHVITEGVDFSFSGAGNPTFKNCNFDDLTYNFMATVVRVGTTFNFIDCTFSNKSNLTTPPTFDSTNYQAQQFLDASLVTPTGNVFYVPNTLFTDCTFNGFPLTDLYTLNTTITNPKMDTPSASFAEAACPLHDPVISSTTTNGKLTSVTFGYGIILSGVCPDNASFRNASTPLVLMPGVQLSGADFTGSHIMLSHLQTLDNVMINWSIFTDATVYYQYKPYQGEAIKTLFAQLGMSQQNILTINVGPSASATVTLIATEIETLPDTASEDGMDVEPTKTNKTLLGENRSGIYGKAKDEQRKDTGKDEEKSTDNGPSTDSKENDGDKKDDKREDRSFGA